MQFIQKPCCSVCSEPFEFDFSNKDNDLICPSCLKKKFYFDKAISCFIYNKTISKIIFDFKFFRKTFIYPFFVKFLLLNTREIIKEVDIIAPVPLDNKRLRWRGYNQSYIIAKDLALKTNTKIIPDLLLKIKHTTPQAKLNNKKRKQNLKSVFILNKKYQDIVKNKNIAIVDDVMTTGTTVNECAKTLKKHNVNKVFVFTIAKTSLHKKDIINFDI